jgi:hypothetical protein
MNITEILYPGFPREIGLRPQSREYFKRELIKTRNGFYRFINEYSGSYELFTSVYDQTKTINKIFVDVDSYTTLQKSLETAKKVYKKATQELNLPVIPIFSGLKGFHLYVLLKPKRYNNPADLLTNVTLNLVSNGTKDEFGISKVLECIDEKFIGATNSLCRIPNTERPGMNTFCVPLPQNFLELSLKQIIQLSKTKRYPKYNFNGYRFCYLTDLTDIKDNVIQQRETEEEIESENFFPKHGDVRKYLRPLLPPCLYNEILLQEPSHEIRVAVTAKLLKIMEPKQIVGIFSRLGWVDYEERRTSYQVRKILQKGLNNYSCKRLSVLTNGKYCEGCDWR